MLRTEYGRQGNEDADPVLPAANPQSSSVSALDALLLFMLFNLSLQPLVDPDFGWHLRTGLDLITNWTLPETDPYSHTVPDWRWVEHAWLMDGLIGLMYRGAGGLGVIVVFGAVIAGAFIVGVASVAASRTTKLLAVVVVAWLALPFLGARMQMVTLLGLAVVLEFWRRYRDGRLSRLWALPPLFVLWANLHGGFTAGLFTLGIVLAISCAARFGITRYPSLSRRIDEPVLSWVQIRHFALILALAALSTLLNPYGWRLHGEIYASLTDRFMIDTLYEWQPVSLHRRAGATYAAYLAVLTGMGVLWYRRTEPVRWAITLVFLVLSLRHWRNVPFFLLVSLPLLADMLTELRRRLLMFLAAARWSLRYLAFGAALVAALAMVLLGADHLQRVAQSGLAPEAFFKDTEYPIEAVQWIEAHRDQLGKRLYNDYGAGGFLLWWRPADKIFIDGRMPAWRVGDRWILYDYLALTNRDPPELGVLDKYQVDWAIVERDTLLERALAARPEWRAIYQDRKVSIYVKA
ncbi:MAG: hypothetical protein ACREJU_09565 [Nitrospiraceae bacterium]